MSGHPPDAPPRILRPTPRWAPALTAYRPVFLDESGRRWRRVRLAARAALGVAAVLVFGTAALAFAGPDLGGVGDTLMRAGRPAPAPAAPRPQSAEQRDAERRLFAALGDKRAATSAPTRAARPDAAAPAAAAPAAGAAAPGGRDPIVAGFYVNWDDNSRASLARNMARLDWVVAEWVFVEPGGDRLRTEVDPRVFALLSRAPAAERPGVLAMVTNVDARTHAFDPARLRRLVGTPAARARAAGELRDLVARYRLAGVTLDFENYPASLDAAVAAFADTLRAALRPLGGVVALTVGVDQGPARAARLAASSDYAFLMLYDQHWRGGPAGPVAAQGWFAEQARRLVGALPPGKAVVAVGAYGYAWNDATREVEPMTHEEVLEAARAHGALPRWDAASLNPYLTWSDPDSTDHVVWFLDAVTGYNQARTAEALGAAGVAVWRLGGEDPALWRALGRRGLEAGPAALEAMRPGYEVQFRGEGEILRVAESPRAGRRALTVDGRTGLVTGAATAALPTPYVVERAGARDALPGGGRLVALTFDDGPDGRWTAPILDTLRARRAPATFFVVGQQVQRHIGLTRRIYREGHELGNHTFTHPDLSRSSPLVTRLELDATNRVLEAVLDRRTALFRPPYFGDAEPTTPDALVPVRAASERGLITAGLHLDSYDWDQPRMDAAAIVRATLRARDARPRAGHVVLLHDGGGDRAATLAAVGPLVDSLRARGDSLVLLSELVGVPRDVAMPPLPPAHAAVRLAELGAYGMAGAVEWALGALMGVAIVLGLARLAVIAALALAQRARRGAGPRGAGAPAAPYAPPVTVVVPAYNEEKVIAQTVASLLQQRYAGPLEIVVVDDGSPDGTFAAAERAFAGDPRVRVFRKANGGKASALNLGVGRAKGEIVVGLDADTVFLPDTVAELVAPLADPRVGAVAGNAKVGNRVNLVTRWQAVEYVTSQNLDRRAFALLDCITVVPGAVGAWRTSVVRAAGGFSDDTLAEDQDLTLAVRRRGYSVAYAERAVAYTEAPDTLRALARQRFRWSFGTLQCMWKHRDALLRRRYGTLGLVAMPNVWLFQLLFAAVSPAADLMAALGVLGVGVTYARHGGAYALAELGGLLGYYAAFVLVDWAAAAAAFWMEPAEERGLTWLVPLQRFAYRQVMYWVVVRSFAAALRGRLVGWGTLERKATVTAPA
jgi:peptidoglycan/xylan/chitin deacetylase (PgdA/CDA1 family)/spore germination protein YaaH/GT2 family glycosyltransferase